MPSIIRDLRVAPSSASWVISANALAFAGFLLVGGRMNDLLGQRRCFAIGLSLFAAASCGSALAPTMALLTLTRGLQGLAAALLSPASFSLINTMIPDGEPRRQALSIFGMTQGLSLVIGLVGGGALVDWLGWRSVFLVNLPSILLCGWLSRRLLPIHSSGRWLGGPPSACVVTLANGLFLWALSQIGPFGLLRNLPALCAALISYLAFILIERRSRRPLIPPSLVMPSVVLGALAGLSMMTGSGALFVLANLELQTLVGLPPGRAGFAMLPYAAAVMLGGWLFPWLHARVSAAKLAGGAMACAVAGLLLLGSSAGMSRYVLQIVPGLVVTALGALTAFLALMAHVTNQIPREHQGAGSALLFTAQQLGIGLGSTAALSALGSRGQGFGAAAFGNGYALAAALSSFSILVLAVEYAAAKGWRQPGEISMGYGDREAQVLEDTRE